MKSTHNWQRKEDAIRGWDNKPGYYIECDGCHHRVFIPDEWSDFQKDLSIIMYFGELMTKILPDTWKDRSVPTPNDKHGFKEKRYHGVLAEDCNTAANFAIEEVMEV